MVKWNSEVNPLYLFTPAEYAKLPDGIELECIDGDKVVKGKDDIDMDIRGGHIAFGVRKPFEHAEQKLFLTFILSQ